MIGRGSLLGAKNRIGKQMWEPLERARLLSSGAEIPNVNVSHSVSVIDDGATKIKIMKAADRVLRGDIGVSHQRDGIDVMMIMTLKIGGTGAEVEMMIPMIPVLPDTVVRIESVMIIRAEGAGKKCTEYMSWTFG